MPSLNHPQKNQDPFASGTPSELSQWMVDMLPSDFGGTHHHLWRDRGLRLTVPLLTALFHLRDNGKLKVDAVMVRSHLNLEKIRELTRRPDMPHEMVEAIQRYLTNLPEYVMGQDTQSDITLEQHGYLQMGFTHVLSTVHR